METLEMWDLNSHKSGAKLRFVPVYFRRASEEHDEF